ncbi:MAG TPA: TIGR00159 family protein [Candidatus Faecousia intestinavium]|nr:TIGR00159 family protein [Candidatus Faecousia intestinavium]
MEALQNFIQNIRSMQWSDYLDILVVAFLIYKLLPLIRTPHMMRLTRTVVLLVLVAVATSELHLYTLNWLLSQLLAIGLLAFVVLFQPELRRMLDHLGTMRLSTIFGTTKPVQEIDAMITQTVRACEIMSEEKVGALIVFAREQHLNEYYKTGTQIDALVSEQLLRNIFFHNSPLHDGAVIIKDGRIAFAGCVMPLSKNPNMPKELGTRHHAALGTSEVTDAVVVVVSEETGTISVAVGGMLKRHLAPQTLEKLLQNELNPAEKQESPQSLVERMKQKITAHGKEEGYEKE